ncbi:MAG: pantoate--beta-alanine ligase [Kiritimatiellae bacterium]|nr:pantoate--beta-alanine ligase [Kiritimatiellia bacterium]
MKIVHTIAEIREGVSVARNAGLRIGFVPTMGFLHDGHLSLIQKAKDISEYVVVSIFVNPTQFGPEDDLDRYPRDLEKDLALCCEELVDIVFVPDVGEIYPEDCSSFVDEKVLSVGLCGKSRPEHFRGVATVVTKLFNIVQPDLAVFGQKDAQQVRVIQRVVRDLNSPVDVIVAPIVRESDGLAMSSRNKYLSESERKIAGRLYQGLCAAEQMYVAGEKNADALRSVVIERITSEPTDVSIDLDYVAVVNWADLSPVTVVNEPTLVAVAVKVGGTRLIDNIVLG